jgi:pimeloyl-ACP methyl ester carboxylesterase
MSEPTRKLAPPTVDKDGSLVAHTVATPKSFKVRALLEVPPEKVVPIIFIPGLMGSNLRMRGDATLPPAGGVRPGDPVWRPPNGAMDCVTEVWNWSRRSPAMRQEMLEQKSVEVDLSGELPASTLTTQQMREQGWGEVHLASYGGFLATLQKHLETTFEIAGPERRIKEHWRAVMACEPARWGVRSVDPLTEAELERYAGYYYPVYAIGYNWLQSCAESAERVRKRVLEIIQHWQGVQRECRQVIFVTHSMGGFVARACARKMPDQVAGIIHGVMPAFGAPVAYRRIACGTEGGRFERDVSNNFADDGFSRIAGPSAETTTPVMAVAPGVLELLPNQLYPEGWLLVRTVRAAGKEAQYRDLLALPKGNPYDFYRDMGSWYRMVDPALGDPRGRYKNKFGGVKVAIVTAINAAERFHTQVLAEGEGPTQYYHPKTYAFYEADDTHKAFGKIRWVAQENGLAVLTPNNVRQAKLGRRDNDGSRSVEVEGRCTLKFRTWLQDAPGDDTVPAQSGEGPRGRVGQMFRTSGFSHQQSYQHADVLLLTQYLIAKIAQNFK